MIANIYWAPTVHKGVSVCFTWTISFQLSTIPEEYCYSAHYADDKTEIQQD